MNTMRTALLRTCLAGIQTGLSFLHPDAMAWVFSKAACDHIIFIISFCKMTVIIEPPHEKTKDVVFEQVWHKLANAVTGAG